MFVHLGRAGVLSARGRACGLEPLGALSHDKCHGPLQAHACVAYGSRRTRGVGPSWLQAIVSMLTLATWEAWIGS
jgi:hypothetical protein